MALNNFKRFQYGIQITYELASDPISGFIGEIYGNTTRDVLRICVSESPVIWQDLYIKDGTEASSTLRWDDAEKKWVENTQLRTDGSSVFVPESALGTDLLIAAGDATDGGEYGGHLYLNTGVGDLGVGSVITNSLLIKRADKWIAEGFSIFADTATGVGEIGGDLTLGGGYGEDRYGSVFIDGYNAAFNVDNVINLNAVHSEDPIDDIIASSVYYNSVFNKLKYFDGTEWRFLDKKGINAVDLYDETYVTLPVTDAELVDGVTVTDGMIVVFSSGYYHATVDAGNITWTLVSLGQDPNGGFTTGDLIIIKAGDTQALHQKYFDGTSWVEALYRGTEIDSTLRWDGDSWVENTSLKANDSSIYADGMSTDISGEGFKGIDLNITGAQPHEDFGSGGDVVISGGAASDFIPETWVALTTYVADDIVKFVNVPLWGIGNTYDVDDVIEYDSIYYKSLTSSNTGNQPDISPTEWEITVVEFINYKSLVSSNTGNQPDSSPTQWEVANIGDVIGSVNVNGHIFSLNVRHDTDPSFLSGTSIPIYYNARQSRFKFTGESGWQAIEGARGLGVIDFKDDTLTSFPVITTVNILSISRVSNVVTVTTDAPHNLILGGFVGISSVSIPEWDVGTTYNLDETIDYNGTYYKSLVGSNTGNQPDTSPVEWEEQSDTLIGNKQVTAINSTTEFEYETVGDSDVTGAGGIATSKISINGQMILSGVTVLFTNLSVPSDNNHVYRLRVDGQTAYWDYAQYGNNPTGEATNGDSVQVINGNNVDTNWFFNGTEWVRLGIEIGTTENSVLTWDATEQRWKEDNTVLIDSYAVFGRNDIVDDTNPAPDFSISASSKLIGDGNGGDLELSAGDAFGAGNKGKVWIDGYSLMLDVPQATDPVSGTEREIIYNTTEKQFKFYDGSSWRVMGGGEIEQVLFVTKAGDNSVADGTMSLPYLTVEAALTKAATLTPASANRIVIYVGPGVYNESALALLPYVDIKGFGREVTEIISITSTWTAGSANVGEVSLSDLLLIGDLIITRPASSTGSASLVISDSVIQGALTFSGLGGDTDVMNIRQSEITGAVTSHSAAVLLDSSVMLSTFTVDDTGAEHNEGSGYTATAQLTGSLLQSVSCEGNTRTFLTGCKTSGVLTLDGPNCDVIADAVSLPDGMANVSILNSAQLTKDTESYAIRYDAGTAGDWETEPSSVDDALDNLALKKQQWGEANQDRSLGLIGGGIKIGTPSSYSWDADAYVQVAGLLPARNTIAAGSVSLADGQVAYVTINRTGTTTTVLTPVVANMADVPADTTTGDDAVIFLRRDGDNYSWGIGGGSGTDSPQTVSFLDNTTNNVLTSVAVASFNMLRIEYSVKRGINFERGTIWVTSDGTNASVSATGSGINDPDIGFDADVNTGNLRVLFDARPTGDAGSIKYIVKDKWLH